ncbi:MAG: hypothetical protein QOI19_976 [Thermoleophilaceae bacterium]|jgi:hypothetical protein|nr:hypothetical protein [Thermoleophilaceae bacterium]
MRLIRVCVVALAASLLVGVPAASAAATLTIKPKNREILYGGKSTKITGHLSGVSPNSGQQIRLQANPYPYNGFVNKGGLKQTDANGNFVFIVKPDRNTRYRALLPGTTTTSPGRTIYVNGVTKWKLKFKKGSRTIKVSFNFTFSPQLDTSLFTGVPLHWYFRTSGQKFHRVRTNKTKRLAQGVIGGNLTYTYPNSVGKKKYFVSWCFRPKQNGDVGVGVPGKAFKQCP